MGYHHPRLKLPKFVWPGPQTRAWLAVRKKRRSAALSYLEKPSDSQCAWCNAGRVSSKRRKYCTNDCAESAYIATYPQSPTAKMYLFLVRQDCVCLACGEWFKDEIDRRVESVTKRWNVPGDFVSLHQIGNGTGHIWQVDHIIPIFKGGNGLGFENLQVICYECHAQKTRRER